MKFTTAFIPGVVGAGVLWYAVVERLPFKEMSPSLGGLALVGLLLAFALSGGIGVMAVTKPHPAWPLVGAALGLGVPYFILAARIGSLASAASGASGDFSWRACLSVLNHHAFQAAGLVFVLALSGSVLWVSQCGWRFSKTRGT